MINRTGYQRHIGHGTARERADVTGVTVPGKKQPRRRQPNQRQVSDAQLAERDAACWALRLQGHSLRTIGTALGISYETVRATLERGYRELVYPQVEEARQLELERLDHLLTKLTPGVDMGDVQSITAAIKVSDRRAKLLGLDAPTKVQAEVEHVPPSPELLARIEQARTVIAAREAQLRGDQ